MNVVEIDRALRRLHLSGMADVLEVRIQGAAAERQPHLDFLSALVGDELLRRQDRLLGRRIKLARFRDNGKTLDSFDLEFNKKTNRQLVYELATARFVVAIAQVGWRRQRKHANRAARREDHANALKRPSAWSSVSPSTR